jgi:hypothetical protein
MMHCTMEDLGALRAGEASVWARRHIPALRPPRDGWPAVRGTLRAARARRRRTWGTWTGSLALAATIAAVLLLRPSDGSLHAELSEAKQQSATLEDSLQQYDIDGRVLSGHAAAVVAELEDRISLVDGTLAQREQRLQDAELVKLWQERVGLMRELVNARATRARYVGL